MEICIPETLLSLKRTQVINNQLLLFIIILKYDFSLRIQSLYHRLWSVESRRGKSFARHGDETIYSNDQK